MLWAQQLLPLLVTASLLLLLLLSKLLVILLLSSSSLSSVSDPWHISMLSVSALPLMPAAAEAAAAASAATLLSWPSPGKGLRAAASKGDSSTPNHALPEMLGGRPEVTLP
jgi:hypothetical protein